MKMEQIKRKLVEFIRKTAKSRPAVIGLSGGVDSAVVAYLAVEALGKNKVFGLILPSNTNTKDDLRLAKDVIKILDIKYLILNIEPILKSYKKILRLQDHKIIGNIKARIRMTILYAKANEINGIIFGTGNKSEISIGYFTKHGDGAVDVLPIGGLYKTQVFELAKYLGVPKEIIDRPPTAGLWKNQYDEKEMGITYKNLDQILEALEKKKSLKKFNSKEVGLVKKMIKDSEHKRQKPPICKV